MVRVLSRCPQRRVTGSCMERFFIRANWELEELKVTTKDLVGDCMVWFQDRGLVFDCYETEFIIFTYTKPLGLSTLVHTIERWTKMASDK